MAVLTARHTNLTMTLAGLDAFASSSLFVKMMLSSCAQAEWMDDARSNVAWTRAERRMFASFAL